MPLKLNRNQLAELIEQMEAGGGDSSVLRRELETLEPEVKPQTRRNSRFREEEETMEERLTRRVGDLFPNGIPFEKLMDYDYHFTLNELREQCRKAGLGIGGDKKELAAKLIARNNQLAHSAKAEEPIYLGEGI